MRAFLGEQTHAFAPETVEVLVGAFNDAWMVVEATEGGHREEWRLILARQVMLIAEEGETDREKLSAEALQRSARARITAVK